MLNDELTVVVEEDSNDYQLSDSKLLNIPCKKVTYLQTDMYFVKYNIETYNDPLLLCAKYLLVEMWIPGIIGAENICPPMTEYFLVSKSRVINMKTDGENIYVEWDLHSGYEKVLYAVYVDEYTGSELVESLLRNDDVQVDWKDQILPNLEFGNIKDYCLDQCIKMRKKLYEQIKKYEAEANRKTDEILKIYQK